MARVEIPQTSAREVLDRMQDHFPHMVFVDPIGKNSDDLDEWCLEMVGACGREPDDPVIFIETDGDWCYFSWYWFFKNPDHATCFRMIYG